MFPGFGHGRRGDGRFRAPAALACFLMQDGVRSVR